MHDVTDMREFNRTLIEEYRATGGKLSGRLANSKLLLLTTTGARSGLVRTTPLGYGMDGDRIVVVAANAGAPAHPDWYHNLRAHPLVTIELGAERFQARAEVAEGPERTRLVAHEAEIVPWLSAQQQKTSREIPVVIFARAG
jgi:deazaflavin-dependent oxidoreductase (nitroreductase family)